MNTKLLKYLPLLGLLFIALALGYVAMNGQSYTVRLDAASFVDGGTLPDVEMDPNGIVALTDQRIEGDTLYLSFAAEKKGKTFVYVPQLDGEKTMFPLRVHAGNIITYRNYLGDCTGGILVAAATALTLLFCIIALAGTYRRSVRENQYRYRNILYLGLLVFLSFLFLILVGNLWQYRGAEDTIRRILDSFNLFTTVSFPVAFVLSILVTISNIDLLRKERRTWRNMLGMFLGLLLLVGTLFPSVLGAFLQRTTMVDVHNENGVALYIERFVENGIFLIIAYLECILIGAIVHGYKAARHIPAFDKDYILILGCMIRKDGTLTPLLRGRVDRAVEFAKMQKEATGKDIMFVPSGGQGPNEVIAEAEAMYNYLVETGIPKEQILVENKSKNTFENFTYSMELIREHSDEPDPQIAFSTTNYHVFRSGFYATKQGIKAEGIGSRTKVYYWVNAYIREFIATLRSEWKTHLAIILTLTALTVLAIGTQWVSANW